MIPLRVARSQHHIMYFITRNLHTGEHIHLHKTLLHEAEHTTVVDEI